MNIMKEKEKESTDKKKLDEIVRKKTSVVEKKPADKKSEDRKSDYRRNHNNS